MTVRISPLAGGAGTLGLVLLQGVTLLTSSPWQSLDFCSSSSVCNQTCAADGSSSPQNRSCDNSTGLACGCWGHTCREQNGSCLMACDESSIEACLECLSNGSALECQTHCQLVCLRPDCNSPECQTCLRGRYGNQCEAPCAARCQGPCFRDTGFCRNCQNGTFGVACEQQCPENCLRCCRQTGRCLRCAPGYHGPPCVAECSPGFYGRGCRQSCSPHCQETCDTFTGACQDCRPGYSGVMCQKQCPAKTYGLECAAECPVTCAGDAPCHHVTGACTRGCLAGFQGEQCLEGCSEGSYGEGCQRNCSLQCLPGGCNPFSGVCSQCRAGWQGAFCQLVTPMGTPSAVQVAEENKPTPILKTILLLGGLFLMGVCVWYLLCCFMYGKQKVLAHRMKLGSAGPKGGWSSLVPNKFMYPGLMRGSKSWPSRVRWSDQRFRSELPKTKKSLPKRVTTRRPNFQAELHDAEEASARQLLAEEAGKEEAVADTTRPPSSGSISWPEKVSLYAGLGVCESREVGRSGVVLDDDAGVELGPAGVGLTSDQGSIGGGKADRNGDSFGDRYGDRFRDKGGVKQVNECRSYLTATKKNCDAETMLVTEQTFYDSAGPLTGQEKWVDSMDPSVEKNVEVVGDTLELTERIMINSKTGSRREEFGQHSNPNSGAMGDCSPLNRGQDQSKSNTGCDLTLSYGVTNGSSFSNVSNDDQEALSLEQMWLQVKDKPSSLKPTQGSRITLAGDGSSVPPLGGRSNLSVMGDKRVPSESVLMATQGSAVDGTSLGESSLARNNWSREALATGASCSEGPDTSRPEVRQEHIESADLPASADFIPACSYCGRTCLCSLQDLQGSTMSPLVANSPGDASYVTHMQTRADVHPIPEDLTTSTNSLPTPSSDQSSAPATFRSILKSKPLETSIKELTDQNQYRRPSSRPQPSPTPYPQKKTHTIRGRRQRKVSHTTSQDTASMSSRRTKGSRSEEVSTTSASEALTGATSPTGSTDTDSDSDTDSSTGLENSSTLVADTSHTSVATSEDTSHTLTQTSHTITQRSIEVKTTRRPLANVTFPPTETRQTIRPNYFPLQYASTAPNPGSPWYPGTDQNRAQGITASSYPGVDQKAEDQANPGFFQRSYKNVVSAVNKIFRPGYQNVSPLETPLQQVPLSRPTSTSQFVISRLEDWNMQRRLSGESARENRLRQLRAQKLRDASLVSKKTTTLQAPSVRSATISHDESGTQDSLVRSSQTDLGNTTLDDDSDETGSWHASTSEALSATATEQFDTTSRSTRSASSTSEATSTVNTTTLENTAGVENTSTVENTSKEVGRSSRPVPRQLGTQWSVRSPSDLMHS